MSEIVGREVKRWSKTLAELNEYDITLVNILLKHCEDLTNKIAEYIGEKQGVCDKSIETLSFGSGKNTKKIKKFNVLEVDSFRGFSVSRTFNLDKKE